MGAITSAYPNKKQREIFNQWIGCARFIWNAKADEQEYLYKFSKKYLPDGTFIPVDQTYSQYKNEDLSPWLFDCPSQILRNSAGNWYQTYQNFLKGTCGKPRRKIRSNEEGVLLTKELFAFEKDSNGVVRLFIGTKTNNVGNLYIKNIPARLPQSLRLKKKNGKFTISYCYEDGKVFPEKNEHLSYLKTCSLQELEKITVGVDRGVAIPVQADDVSYDFTPEQKKKKKAKEYHIKKCQKDLARQEKKSKRRAKKKLKISKAYEKIANIRKDFSHKTSRSIVDNKETKVIVLEDLKTKQMTKAPLPKKDKITKKWASNHKKSKAGLNKSILDKGWSQIEAFIDYKATRAGKIMLKISAYQTSIECADCGHTHPDNRKTQKVFICENCGHQDNADRNAARVIKKRAIKLLLYSGTELSKRSVLIDSGRGATNKTRGAKANRAQSGEASKKKELRLLNVI